MIELRYENAKRSPFGGSAFFVSDGRSGRGGPLFWVLPFHGNRMLLVRVCKDRMI